VANSKTFETHSGDRFFLVAAMMATLAAIFMVTVWAPLQVRAFTQASAPVADWTRVPFVTADGNTTSLGASNGQVRVVTMMYTHCPGICPLAVSTLQRMDGQLTQVQQRKVAIVALSLDPERDSLARLREFRDSRGIDSQRWTVARPSVEGTRELAAGMGVDYKVRDDDTVDHQSVFVLLGKSGEVLARSSNTRSVDPRFFGALQAALNAN
jgi:protein SCO1